MEDLPNGLLLIAAMFQVKALIAFWSGLDIQEFIVLTPPYPINLLNCRWRKHDKFKYIPAKITIPPMTKVVITLHIADEPLLCTFTITSLLSLLFLSLLLTPLLLISMHTKVML